MKTFKGRGPSAGGARRPSTGARPPFKRSFGGADGAPARDKVLFAATCSSCHKPCQVPFEPNGRKPVYCRDCFIPKEEKAERGERTPFNSFDKRGAGKFPPKRSFDDRAPERTMYPRPEARAASVADATARQLAELNAKVDALIQMVEKMSR